MRICTKDTIPVTFNLRELRQTKMVHVLKLNYIRIPQQPLDRGGTGTQAHHSATTRERPWTSGILFCQDWAYVDLLTVNPHFTFE